MGKSPNPNHPNPHNPPSFHINGYAFWLNPTTKSSRTKATLIHIYGSLPTPTPPLPDPSPPLSLPPFSSLPFSSPSSSLFLFSCDRYPVLRTHYYQSLPSSQGAVPPSNGLPPTATLPQTAPSPKLNTFPLHSKATPRSCRSPVGYRGWLF